MDDWKKWIDNALKELAQERDELRVKVRLAKMEANDEWHELEEKFAALDSKASQLRKATAESAGDIGAAAKLLASEIREGFRNVAKNL